MPVIVTNTVEQRVRTLMHYLPSLQIADATGDSWLVTSTAAAAANGVEVEQTTSETRLVLLRCVPRGPLSAVMEAHLLASRLPRLVSAEPLEHDGHHHDAKNVARVICLPVSSVPFTLER